MKVWQVWNENGVWLSPLEFAELGSSPEIDSFLDRAFVPEHIDERILAQGSVFMCEPRGKKLDWQLHTNLRDKKPSTLKVRIPWDFRESLRNELDLVGINRATLFPGLDSAASYLAWAVHQRKRPYSN